MRRITVGKYPINDSLVHISKRIMTVPDSPAKIEFTSLGLTVGDPAGTVSSVAEFNISANLPLKFNATSGGFTAFQPSETAVDTTYVLPPQDGTDTQSLVTDGSANLRWESVKYLYSVKVGGFTAESWQAYFVDTTAGFIAATLPLNPTMGDTIRFFDLAGTFDTNPLVVVRNGELIMGDNTDMQVNTVNAAFDIVYSNSTYGWRIITV